FARLADELKDHTLGVLLYYVGDPLMHPELAEICRITHAVGLNAHVSTNFSFSLRDEQLDELITSGLTHLTICVDGFTQQNYERTRVDGGLDRVAGNLRRACAIRRAHRRRFPRIEVQYIKYQHNLHEIEAAHKFYRALGVDQVHEVWGWLHNYTDRDPGKYDVFRPRRPRMLPRCHWPYLFTVVKYDGAVLPCCAFRLGHQYTDCDDPRDVGNTFKNSFWEIWTSPAYRTVRRFACDPTLAERDASLAENFCHACPRLFETNYTERTCRFANEHTFEQLYTIGPDGRPRRRPETMPSPCGLGAPPPSCTPVHSEPGLGT
ncbi:MAG: SPASM domain-containing protein, partial [Phycisphaerales bacterium]